MEKAVGPMLREWRTRRRLSQYDLAGEAHVSSRHLSFIETGRTQPSRDMVLLLAEHLNIPLRERNVLLIAAGYAPVFSQKTLADTSLDTVRQAVDLVLMGHEPFPALAVDRSWNLVAANRAVSSLLQGVDAALLEAPANVLRLSLHPAGLASRIVNSEQWRAHILERLRQQIEVSADAILIDLLKELRAYPIPSNSRNSSSPSNDLSGIVVPFQLRTEQGTLSFISMTTVFGTPIDVTVSELAIESFFPANAATADAMRNLLKE